MTGTPVRRLAGRTYLERGAPVTIAAQWGPAPRLPRPAWLHWHLPPRGPGQAPADLPACSWPLTVPRRGDGRAVGAPRNVLIRRAGGELAARPFRGLRKTAG